MSEIVKVQLPCWPPEAPALLYGQGHKHQTMIPVDDDVKRRMGTKLKAYFHAEWTGETWAIGERAPDQHW